MNQIPITSSFHLQFGPNQNGIQVFLSCLKDNSLGRTKSIDITEICGVTGAKQRYVVY